MVIASPWSRGGCVCSQVFDNTSVLQFLEKFLTHKTGKDVVETNISSWRRAICGDLTSAFQPSPSDKDKNPTFVERDPFVEQIYNAQFKPLPNGYKALTSSEINEIKQNPAASTLMQHQEPGIRRSCPLPYELSVDTTLNDGHVSLRLNVKKDRFGDRAVGCPFTVYARTGKGEMTIRNFAVAGGDTLEDSWPIADFAGGKYHLQVYGPNGFLREFVGSPTEDAVEIHANYAGADGNLNGNVELKITNRDKSRPLDILVADQSYKAPEQQRSLKAGETATLTIDTQPNHNWYDFIVRVAQLENFQRRFAGRVETGQWTFSDPAMGRLDSQV